MMEWTNRGSPIYHLICLWICITITVIGIKNVNGALESMESSESLDDEVEPTLTTRRLPDYYDLSSVIPETAASYPTRHPSALPEPVGFYIPKNRLINIKQSDAVNRFPWSTRGTVHIYPTKVPPRTTVNPYSIPYDNVYARTARPKTTVTRDNIYAHTPRPVLKSRFSDVQNLRNLHKATRVPQSRNPQNIHFPPPPSHFLPPLRDTLTPNDRDLTTPSKPDNRGKENFKFSSTISLNTPPLQNMEVYNEFSEFDKPSSSIFRRFRRPTRKFEIQNQKLENFSNSSVNSSLDDIAQDSDDSTTINPFESSLSSVKISASPGNPDSVVTRTTLNPNNTIHDDLSVGLADDDEVGITAGAIAGIVIGALSSVALLAGIALFVMYKRPFGKSPHVDHPSQNNVYIDDTIHVGYLNHHIELPKESPEEMTSLDNDAFLNSLEAVTIQNYWADNTRNTKV